VTHAAATIEIVAAVITDGCGKVLVVRKRGATRFMQPGGKPGTDGPPLSALARELHEELGLAMDPSSVIALGTHEDWAVNEPGHRVRARAWWVHVTGMPRPQAEIAELAWIELHGPPSVDLAPLSAGHILPAARKIIPAA